MPIVCSYKASIRVSGATKPLREVAFKTRDAADAWLAKQRAFAKNAGWAGLTFETREDCHSKKR